MITLFLAIVAAAQAGALDDHLAQATAAIQAGQFKSADKLLEQARDDAAALDTLASGTQVAQIAYLRGLNEHLAGDPKDRAMDDWRAALAIDIDHAWDSSLLADSQTQDLYLALRSEVRSNPSVAVGVPDKTGEAKIYVDGVRKRAGDTVFQGEHLGQIVCPDATVHSVWTRFDSKVRWFKMCPGGVDTSVVVADDPAGDEWGDLGPAFGGVVDTPAVSADSTVAQPGSTEPLPTGDQPEVIRRKIHWPLVAGAGASLVAGGIVYASALHSRQDFDDLDNAELNSVAAIEDLRAKTNNQVIASTGLGVVAAGLYVAAFIQW